MPTQPQIASPPLPIKNEVVGALRNFVRAAIPQLSEELKAVENAWMDETRWARGIDGNFRENLKRVYSLWPALNGERLHKLTGYTECVRQLKDDVVFSSHLDCLVGTRMGSVRIEADSILTSLIYSMLDVKGQLSFTDEKFDSELTEWVDFFRTSQIDWKMVAPLPFLIAPVFPLQLNHDVVLDRLTEDEVGRCCQSGILRPHSPRFPIIDSNMAVGIRRTIGLPKTIHGDNNPYAGADAEGEGSFGKRPCWRDDLVVDDVLSALRLTMRTDIRTAGHASWTDTLWLNGSMSFRVLAQWPYGGGCNLSESDVSELLNLWQLLQNGASRFRFSVHRFNLAFDRGLLDDRLVDLVIAAEALFLSDMNSKDRGELRFRISLRAAKFIEHPIYSEYEVFRLMRQAYDNRSAIVHGGSAGDTHLPDNHSANLSVFIDAIEELVRLALRKALAMKEAGKKLREPDYWDTLVLSKPVAAPQAR